MMFTFRIAALLVVVLIVFLHYWGTGPAEKLATGFKAAVSELGKSAKSTAVK